MNLVSLEDVRRAAAQIGSRAHRTPVITCQSLDQIAGRKLFFKCEHLQRVGAFKFRGATNAVQNLPQDLAQRGVVTHSSGNHAQALALAAQQRGVKAHIVMPSNASPAKRCAAEAYGARILECAPTLEARESLARQVCKETGAIFIHPYDNVDVIAGQGTVALELLEQVEGLDAIITPIGGGGLTAGVAVAATTLAPGIEIIAAEPANADDAFRSKQLGERVLQLNPNTIADGLRTSLGEITWPIVRDHVNEVIRVSEEEIVSAMQLAWQRAKMLVEASSAVALAAALGPMQGRPGLSRVGIVLSGGNVDLTRLPWQ